AQALARLTHPHIAEIHEYGVHEGAPYLVMEYVEGETLSGLLRGAAQAGQRIPLDIALRVAVDILAGLEAAHSLQDDDGHPLRVVHRDVTPQNILVGADGVTRLLDFGIATAALRSATTKEGQLKGKFGYMAPELLDGGEASPQTDAYSAGVTIWETLTGEHLFDGKTELDVAAAVLRCVVPPLKNHRDDVPGEVEAVLRRALARDPGDRYASAAEFGRALEGAGVPLASTRAVSTFVESTVGVMLESRRAKFAAALKASPATATDEVTQPPVHTSSAAGTNITGLDAPTPRSPRRLRAAWIGVAVVALVLGALYLLTRPPSAVPADDSVRLDPLPREAAPSDPGTGVVPPGTAPVEAQTSAGPDAAPAPPDAGIRETTPPHRSRKSRRTRQTPTGSGGQRWWPDTP
ncbi:MAG: serine/threonine protein kinase, partial [Myxococcales bacterium]|nr:serine/threonine protein kinase [Myxococcales bacterium]